MRALPFHRFFLAFLIVFYVVVRFWHSTDSCLWFDEIFSVHAAEHSWPDLFRFVADDLIHPPLFYILLKFWIAIGGESLFWLRSLPVLISALAVIPFFLLCRRLDLRPWTVALAFLFISVNGSLIKYSQEVRMYSLLLCFALFSVWLFIRWQREGKSFVALTVINILLVYTHYFGWLIIFTELIAVFVFDRRHLRRICAMASVVLTAFSPWVIAVWRASSGGEGLSQNIGWIERPTFASLFQFLLSLCEPFYSAANTFDEASIYKISVPILVLVAIAVMAFIIRGKNTAEFGILRLFAVVPAGLAFALSWLLPYSIWGMRHLIIVFPFFAIIFGLAISSLKSDWFRIGTITLLVLLIGYGFVLQAMRPTEPQIWCAWEEIAPKIGIGPQKLYVFEDLNAYHFWFATRNRSDLQIIKVNGMPEMTEDKAYFLPRGFDGIETINANQISGDHFWIAFRDMEWNKKHPPLNILLERGYKIGPPNAIDAGGLKAFLVEVNK